MREPHCTVYYITKLHWKHSAFRANLTHLARFHIFKHIYSYDTTTKTIDIVFKIKSGGNAGFQHLKSVLSPEVDL